MRTWQIKNVVNSELEEVQCWLSVGSTLICRDTNGNPWYWDGVMVYFPLPVKEEPSKEDIEGNGYGARDIETAFSVLKWAGCF